MSPLDYSGAGVPIRDDIRQAQTWFFGQLRSPGTWWTGAERLAIAAESRKALHCPLCRARKEALAPAQVRGEHAGGGRLPAAVVEVAHRVRTDPARLSHGWFEAVMGELSVERYVEAVGSVTMLTGIDTCCRALGIPTFPLPEPLPGEPSRRRPEGVKEGKAWVPMLAPEDTSGPEADLYPEAPMIPNIMRALSLVPDQARALQRLSDAHYVPVGKITDPTHRRDLTRPQMELVAARVSALNECFY
jgi:hypothetical protein